MTSEPHASADAPQQRADQRLRERYAAQRVLWRVSTHDRVRLCGARASGEFVQLRVTTGPDGARHAGFGGLQTCGSVWSCPVCSAKILARRQAEIATAVDRAAKMRLRTAMFTYTMRHNAGQSLEELWNAQAAGWHAITAGSVHQAEKITHGIETGRELITECPAKSCGTDTPRGRKHAAFCKIGTYKIKSVLPWIRVVEVTHGVFGWHVHVHVLVFLPESTTDAARDALYEAWWTRWNAGLVASGVDGSMRVNRAEWMTGKEISRKVGSYVTKQTYSAGEQAGLEMARGDLKSGRFENRSAFQILRDLVLQPTADVDRDTDRPVHSDSPASVRRDAALWAEFEAASAGRRQIAWAVGFRDLLDLGDEQTDEDIASEELGTHLDTIAQVDSADWRKIARVPGRRLELLVSARVSDAAARNLLDSWGVSWTFPVPSLT